MLRQAKKMTSQLKAREALVSLEKIYELLCRYGFEKYISFDLGMLSEYHYYTGTIFKGYTYGTGDTILKGGRYDSLIGQFGKDAASTGFAIEVDRLLTALSRQNISIPLHADAMLILYNEGYIQTAIELAALLRSRGQAAALLYFPKKGLSLIICNIAGSIRCIRYAVFMMISKSSLLMFLQGRLKKCLLKIWRRDGYEVFDICTC